MNLSPVDFWNMRLKDFFLKLQFRNEQEQSMIRLKCNLIRTQTTILFNTQTVKEDRKKPEELWKFPWDKKEESSVVEMTEEEYKKRSDKLFEMI